MSLQIVDTLQDRLAPRVNRLWKDPHDPSLVAATLRFLDEKHRLSEKIAAEAGVEQIILQMFGRLADAYGRLSELAGKTVLDIACGSNTSRAPESLRVDTPFGEAALPRAKEGYTALFEPWFCRMLLALGAHPVGVDLGDLYGEAFAHYRVDLGKPGALDFLPDHSFDAIQDSRLFGSPEFTAQFPDPDERLRVAREIRQQEQRLLREDGILIHSDARALVG